jgi:2-hydroxy-3-keto-5-methylthiopentenyl-1-phosphate phosphatase
MPPAYDRRVVAPLSLDLSRTAVFLDFDGTITTVDSGRYTLGKLAPVEWHEIADAYRRGEIGSRECLLDEWDLLPKDEAQLRTVAREVPIDAGLEALLAGLRRAGTEITVVSDGFGYYAEEVCSGYDVPLLTNSVDWDAGELVFPHEDRCCPCSTCGVCKQAPIKDARHRGLTTVLVGDGTSDYKAALLADVVFAKHELRSWCERNGVEHIGFEKLADVADALLP